MSIAKPRRLTSAWPHGKVDLAKADRLWPRIALRALLLFTNMSILACTIILSCGNPVVFLDVSAPPVVTAGSSFEITVTAIANGKRDRIFNSPIQFESTDAVAVLPAIYTLRPSEAGSHTFTGITLMTAGSQTIKVRDINAPSINGSANVIVSAVARAVPDGQ